jgi:hypothetical protein
MAPVSVNAGGNWPGKESEWAGRGGVTRTFTRSDEHTDLWMVSVLRG